MADVTSSIPATPKLGIRVSDAVLSPVPAVELSLLGSYRCRIPNCECPCHIATKPMVDTEDTSPLEAAVARAKSWKDLPQSALRAMFATSDNRQRTRIAHERLAEILGGSTKVPRLRTPIKRGMVTGTRSGIRLYDVLARGRFIEVKLGGDRVTALELKKDCHLMVLGIFVEYHFVCNPCTGKYHNPLDIKVLEDAKIPYRIWGWGFWNP